VSVIRINIDLQGNPGTNAMTAEDDLDGTKCNANSVHGLNGALSQVQAAGNSDADHDQPQFEL
jgi:hypothetical protein